MAERAETQELYDNHGELILTGSSNAYVAEPARAISGYFRGLRLCGRANHTNTGASTLEIVSQNAPSGLGAIAIRKGATTALSAGDLIEGKYYDFIYDAANNVFQVMDVPQFAFSGSDGTIVTGTAGSNGELAAWNGDGDLVGSGYGVLDEDNLASDSDAAVPTQQSVKAYADAIAASIPAVLFAKMEYYTAGEVGAETNSSLTLGGPEEVVMSIGPMDLSTDDLIITGGEAQFSTNETTFNTLVTSRLIVASSDSSVTVLQELAEANGRNLTPAVHHDAHQKFSMVRSTVSDTDRYINFVSRCASSSGTLDIVIDSDYGRLYALVIKDFFA